MAVLITLSLVAILGLVALYISEQQKKHSLPH